MNVNQATEGFLAVCKLAKARSVEDHCLSRRIDDEMEVVRLYRAAVYGGDGRQADMTDRRLASLEAWLASRLGACEDNC
jgi:hypothetical protein